jgi:metal-responsive CopG/Arc/MetJ family transcriptional regulator
MDSYAPSRRIADGRRRIQLHMPAKLVVELDQAIAAEYSNNTYWSRADVVAVAVRRFLDQGGMQLMPASIGELQ